ncbi:MAG TPA: helix-turn-helix domain-containing protein [Caulobacteraceae bacterium]
MKAWTFTTDAWPLAERARAWEGAMHRLGLPVGGLPDGTGPRASVTSLTSPLGLEFALIDAGPQTISSGRADLPSALWLWAMLEGRARIEGEGVNQVLNAGDIAYGPSGRMATLILPARCRLLCVRLPQVALGHHLVGNLRSDRLIADDGLAGVFSGLLAATARSLANLSDDELRPVELALTEFLGTLLAEEAGLAEAQSGGAQLHRLSQIVEGLLADPDLSLARLASESGLAPRTIQKIFAAGDDTFAGYVRARRLERSRADLESPLSAALSIAEIARRWGFSDPAYFSRAFRSAFGASPRDHRRESRA